MTSPFLPLPERREAIDRLMNVLLSAEIEETMSLSAILITKILLTYGVTPGTAQWRAFFRTLSECCAEETAQQAALRLPLQ
jgi:hypothetical protein